jgi:hypothetical protein
MRNMHSRYRYLLLNKHQLTSKVGGVVHDKESIHNMRIWKARRCHLNQQNLLFHSKTLQKQFVMLVLRSFHSPLVVIPFEKEKHIPNSQHFLEWQWMKNMKLKLTCYKMLHKFLKRNRCSRIIQTSFSHNKDFED